jgi:polysaccharide pyruvyl transferase WcaK-like protein
MKGILEQLTDIKDKVVLVPRTLNAAQLKYLISKLQFFIGARTHATIAAFSMGIPTISIAYSVKAKGINKDLFGDTRFVLETPKVDKSSLIKALELLEQEEQAVHSLLSERIPLWRQRAFGSVDVLKKMFS